MAWPGNDLKIRDKCRIYWLYFLKNKIDFKSVTVYMQGELSSISCCFYLLIQQHSKKKKQPCKSYPAVASMLTKEQLLAEQPGNSARGTPGASASFSDLSKWTLPCQTTSVSVPHFLFCYLSSLGVEDLGCRGKDSLQPDGCSAGFDLRMPLLANFEQIVSSEAGLTRSRQHMELKFTVPHLNLAP